MKSALRATAILSSSSMVTILIGLVSAKAWAVLLGTSGLGYMGLLQSLVGLAGLVAGTGVGTGLVRMSANALARDNQEEVAALHRAAWLLCWASGALAFGLMTIFRVPISSWMLGGAEHSWDVVLMGLVLLANLAFGVQTSILNAYHRVAVLAKISVLQSVVGTPVSVAAVWLWRENGIVPAIVAGAAIGLGVSWWYLNRNRQPLPAASRPATARAARSLLKFGGPYTASLLVGTGVQFVMPALVLHVLNEESVGLYRAAIAISVTYLGFLMFAMGQDYYPRVSAASDRPELLIQLVNQQHRLVLLLAVPLILGALTLAPLLVPLIYTPRFGRAVGILEWQLVGDLIKFSSWTLGYVIVARSSGRALFLVELLVGVNMLLLSWLGVRWFGLDGLGVGFAATYLVHFIVVWTIVRRDIRLVWTMGNKLLFVGGASAALLICLLPRVGLEFIRMPVSLGITLLASAGSLYTLWQDVLRERMSAGTDNAMSPG